MRNILYSLVLLATFSCSCAPERAAEESIIREATVAVEFVIQGQVVAAGSGTIVANNGHYLVLTAAHVTDGSVRYPDAQMTVTTHAEKNIPASLVSKHQKLDASLLSFDSTVLYPVAQLFEKLTPLSEVVCAGYPMNMFLCITEGLLNYSIANTLEDCWSCTADAYPGNSGGGIWYKDTNKLIGVCVSIAVSSDFGYSVPVTHMNAFIPVGVLAPWLKQVLS
ncbi:MAG: trypsin-like peptidase domain-containing protein [Candidatus Riesia sp.]|nr:trypsin-like peptidase domain-containing protein [Candidatus Riesia sp.]